MLLVLHCISLSLLYSAFCNRNITAYYSKMGFYFNSNPYTERKRGREGSCSLAVNVLVPCRRFIYSFQPWSHTAQVTWEYAHYRNSMLRPLCDYQMPLLNGFFLYDEGSELAGCRESSSPPKIYYYSIKSQGSVKEGGDRIGEIDRSLGCRNWQSFV